MRKLTGDDEKRAKQLAERIDNALKAGRLSEAAEIERAGVFRSMRPSLAAALARLGQPAAAWQVLEEALGRDLLDELAARQDRRLSASDRRRIRQLTAELERLDKAVESNPKGLDQAERSKRFAELRRQRELANIALGEFQRKLVQEYGALAGQVAKLEEIQAVLPTDAALIAWIDLSPVGPNAANPGGEHWAVVVRARGIPLWVPIAGTGPNGRWTDEDKGLTDQVRTALASQDDGRSIDLQQLLHKLRAQRIEPLAKVLGATADGLPPARRLIALPSTATADIPLEVLLSPRDTRTVSHAPSATILSGRASEGATTEHPTWMVSYAPSGTIFKYLRERPRLNRHAGLLVLGDPVFEQHDKPGDQGFAPLPETRREVHAIARVFRSDDRPVKVLLGVDASEPELDRVIASGELGRFGFIHLATQGVIDEAVPHHSALILTQTGLPDPLDQFVNHKPVYDGRLSVREIQRTWDLKAELVTLSARGSALGRASGRNGVVGFTQALLMTGACSVCLPLWKVDDKATALLMTRFYQNMLGKRPRLSKPLPKAEAIREAKMWLRGLTRDAADAANSELEQVSRGDVRPSLQGTPVATHPYEHPHYWAAFVLVGDPD
jgi:CHAT domain-containing protein